MNKAHWKALEYMRDGMFVPPELTEQMIKGIRKKKSVGVAYSFEMLETLHAKGFKDVTLIVEERPMKYIINICSKYGYEVKTMNEIEDMKFDLVIGNPPYGKNANLAIDFINRAADYSDTLIMVLPKTLKKKSAVNRVRDDLHLIEHVDNPDDAFGIESGLRTCNQTWVLDKTKKRTLEIVRKKSELKDYFEFVDMASSDIAISRVGRGAAGRVFTREDRKGNEKKYEDKSPNSHYFIKVKKKAVLKQLRSLEEEMKALADDTVSNPSLSIDDIAELYLEKYA